MHSPLGIAQRYPLSRRQPSRPPLGISQEPREYFAPVELGDKVLRHLRPVGYAGASKLKGRVYTFTQMDRDLWKAWPMAKRIAFLRDFIEDTSRDPAIVEKTTRILKSAGVAPKDFKAQWAALLKWVQENIYYVNERDERIQSPQYTLTEKQGDCDDMLVTLAALGDSIRLPWKITISGKDKAGRLRVWSEGGGPIPRGVDWTHIYAKVGGPPFRPTWWTWAEPTLHVPLGWSVQSRDQSAARGRADLGFGEGSSSASLPSTSPGTPSSSGGGGLQSLFQKIPWSQVTAGVVTAVISATVVDAVRKHRRVRTR